MAQPNLSSDLLRTYIAVIEHEGFIRAAEVLHKTQSTVSQQIKKLESEVGVDLFRSAGRKRVLTGEGEMLLGYARRMLALQDDAIASLQVSDASGELRLGVSQGMSEGILPGLLANYSRSHPAIRFNVETAYSPDLNAGFERGEYDLVLTLSMSESDGLGCLLGAEPLAWIGAEGWQWSGHREVPLAMYSSQCQFRRVAMRALEKAGIPSRLMYTTSSYQGLMAAVKSGLAITARPQSAATEGTEFVGSRLGLPELPNVYSWLRYAPGLAAGPELEELFRSSALKAH
ncbi:LysR substrate-binding domain-containing protein [Neptuniibacter halophilus]|uniref:LysR substrate-binding domain-containing protein n=1 Tax=Neptuniibacter halophilus TaxID=651666 RepID=UPI0025728F0F|nr:LysR substrate-binding domain-containing protein [Neptuniibacter halophilus]